MKNLSLQDKAAILFEATILVVLAIGVAETRNWPYETALLPRTIGIVVMGLVGVILTNRLIKIRLRNAPKEMDSKDSNPAPKSEQDAPSLWHVMALVAFCILIWMIGFYPASFIYLLLVFQRWGRMLFVRSLIIAAIATLSTFLIFHVALNVPIYQGFLRSLIH